jgi:hypothetical protein
MTRGGKRPGAGRPRGTGKPPEERRRKVSIRLAPSLLEWLRSQPQGLTATIETLIEQAMIDQGRKPGES